MGSVIDFRYQTSSYPRAHIGVRGMADLRGSASQAAEAPLLRHRLQFKLLAASCLEAEVVAPDVIADTS